MAKLYTISPEGVSHSLDIITDSFDVAGQNTAIASNRGYYFQYILPSGLVVCGLDWWKEDVEFVLPVQFSIGGMAGSQEYWSSGGFKAMTHISFETKWQNGGHTSVTPRVQPTGLGNSLSIILIGQI